MEGRMIYALILDGQLRMLSTDESEVYRIADGFEKDGGWNVRVESIPEEYSETDIKTEYNLG